jgi:hypothetical protein
MDSDTPLPYVATRCDLQNSPSGLFLFLDTLPRIWWGVCDGVLQGADRGLVRLESGGERPGGHRPEMGVGEAICTMREVVAVVNRPQDIEDEEAMTFFGGGEGDAEESQG